MLRFRAIGKFLSLLRQQSARALVLELFFNPAMSYFKGRGRGRFNPEQLEDNQSGRGRADIISIILRGEDRIHELRGRPETGEKIAAGEEVRCNRRYAGGGRGGIHAL